MATIQLDARGMKCPLPVLKLNNLVLRKEAKAGDTVVVNADCPTFEADVRKWCQEHRKVLVVVKDLGTHKQAEIRV